MSDSQGEIQEGSHSDEEAGKSPRRTLLVTLIMLGFAVLTFVPPILTRRVGDFFVAIWETLVIVAVFTSMTLVKRLMEAERSRDTETAQPPEPVHSH